MKYLNIKTLSVAVPLMMLLSGCQTTNNLSTKTPSMALNSNIELSQAEQAKAELKVALKKQLRSSFSFKTNVKLSNAKRRAVLANATPEQLASTGDKMDYCEDSHDQEYVNLLKKAMEEGYDIEDTRYDNERAVLMSSYQECSKQYDQWYEDYYNGDGTEEYMPDYDNKHSSKDVKKANVRNEYLFKPLDFTVQGSYQPLLGKIGILPSAQFDSRNLFIRISQPIFIDVNKGSVYVWAENFALMNSELVDETLGTQWKNKWLQIDLNDGSLPDDFTKNLFMSAMKAMDAAYKQESTSDFDYVATEELSQSLPYIDKSQYELMAKSGHVISRMQTAETAKHHEYVFNKTLFEEIKKSYPELLVEDGEVTNKVSSKDIIHSLMTQLESKVKSYENRVNDNKSDDSQVVMRQHFGLNRGKLLWMQSRYELENKKLPDEGMIVDSLTRFDTRVDNPFSTLTSNIQMPNNDNVIDARAYLKGVFNHYENGKGTTLGKLFYQGFMKGYHSKMAENSYPNQIDKEGSAEAIASKDDTKPLSSSSIVINDRDDIEVNENVDHESAQCVLMSVSLDMMCEASNIDINDTKTVESCEQEKTEMTKIYNAYCQ